MLLVPRDVRPKPRARRTGSLKKDSSNITMFVKPGVKMSEQPRPKRSTETATATIDQSPAVEYNYRVDFIVAPPTEEGELEYVHISVRAAKEVNKYIKLTQHEQEIVVNLHKKHIAAGVGVNHSVETIKKLHPRFCKVSKASLSRWSKEGRIDEHGDAHNKKSRAGRPKIVTADQRREIAAQVESMRDQGIHVSTSLVAMAARKYLTEQGCGDILAENGGPFKAGETWCLELLHEHKLAYRKCTTQAAKLPEDWELKGLRLALQMVFLVHIYSIPPCLVVNSDQNGVRLTPAPDYQWAPKGAKDVSTNGFGEKRQITVTPSSSAAGDNLPMQVILQGTTKRSLPSQELISGIRFPGWLWSYTQNHWSNLQEQMSFIRHIIAPYFKRKIAELGLGATQKAIHLIDCWPVHTSLEYRTFMQREYPWILVLYVPPSCTSKLQPQDKFYQTPFKAGMKTAFIRHQVKAYDKARETGNYAELTDFKIFKMKPHLPDFLYAGWSAVKPEMVRSGWDACGLRGAWDGRKSELLEQAQQAMHNESHELYPLFPKSGKDQLAALPVDADDADVKEPTMEPIALQHDELDMLLADQQKQLDQQLPDVVRHVQQIIADQEATPAHSARRAGSLGCKRKPLHPLLARVANRARTAEAAAPAPDADMISE